jgi:hypothetical protein
MSVCQYSPAARQLPEFFRKLLVAVRGIPDTGIEGPGDAERAGDCVKIPA